MVEQNRVQIAEGCTNFVAIAALATLIIAGVQREPVKEALADVFTKIHQVQLLDKEKGAHEVGGDSARSGITYGEIVELNRRAREIAKEFKQNELERAFASTAVETPRRVVMR